ncbi:1989_t:CDS:1, partial [Scutellospora calospora]
SARKFVSVCGIANMEPADEPPSESFHTIPIYQFDASSDSDSDDPGRIVPPIGP